LYSQAGLFRGRVTNKRKHMTKKITPPKGWLKDKPWTEKDAAEATAAAGLGLSRSDFSDDAADLQDLKESLGLLKTDELVEIVIDQSKQLEKITGGY